MTPFDISAAVLIFTRWSGHTTSNNSQFHYSASDVADILRLFEQANSARMFMRGKYGKAVLHWGNMKKSVTIPPSIWKLRFTSSEKFISPIQQIISASPSSRELSQASVDDIINDKIKCSHLLIQRYLQSRMSPLCELSWKKVRQKPWPDESTSTEFSNYPIFGMNWRNVDLFKLRAFLFGDEPKTFSILKSRLESSGPEGVSLGVLDQDIIRALPMIIEFFTDPKHQKIHEYLCNPHQGYDETYWIMK